MSDQSGVVPAPRKPIPVILGPQPKQVAQILTEDELTPFEREQLAKKFGYTGGAIPSDIASRISPEEAKSQFLAEVERAQNLGVDGFQLPGQSLDIDKIRTVKMTDAALSEQYQQIADRINAGLQARQAAPHSNRLRLNSPSGWTSADSASGSG